MCILQSHGSKKSGANRPLSIWKFKSDDKNTWPSSLVDLCSLIGWKLAIKERRKEKVKEMKFSPFSLEIFVRWEFHPFLTSSNNCFHAAVNDCSCRNGVPNCHVSCVRVTRFIQKSQYPVQPSFLSGITIYLTAFGVFRVSLMCQYTSPRARGHEPETIYTKPK